MIGHISSDYNMMLATGSTVQFSHSIVSDALQNHGLQHARPLCLSPTPRVYPNSCPLSQWCHPTISSSVVPFSSHLQSFAESESFQMSQFFKSGGQSIGVSASKSVLPMNPALISFRMDWLDLLAVQGTLKSLLLPSGSQFHSGLCMLCRNFPWSYLQVTATDFFGPHIFMFLLAPIFKSQKFL